MNPAKIEKAILAVANRYAERSNQAVGTEHLIFGGICDAFRELADEIDDFTTAPALDYHNPDNLPSPGEAPWRFLVKGEEPLMGPNNDQMWLAGTGRWEFLGPWVDENGRYESAARFCVNATKWHYTYRTRRPLPAAPAPAPEGRGETAECDALFPTPGSIAWDEFIEAHGELESVLLTAVQAARRLERERNEARAWKEEIQAAIHRSGLGILRTSQGPVGTMVCTRPEVQEAQRQRTIELVHENIDLKRALAAKL